MSKVKVGDRVVCVETGGNVNLTVGKESVVIARDINGICTDNQGYGHFCRFKLSVTAYPNPPHKHAELIKAWADGAEIQYQFSKDWADKKSPKWDGKGTYRIKPAKSDREIQIEKLEEQAQQLAKDIAKLKES